jgi:predicted nucleic acid-binding protein
MDIIVDTSVLIAVITNEPSRPRLIELTAEAHLLAPGSVPWEIGNAFSAMLKRKRATLEQVRQAWNAYEQIPLRLLEVEMGQVLSIAAQYDVYAYDAYFIACALQQKSALLTLDGGLRQAAIQAGVTILEVTE